MEIIEMRPRRSELTVLAAGSEMVFAVEVCESYVALLSVISSLFQYKKVLQRCQESEQEKFYKVGNLKVMTREVCSG